MNKKQKMQYVIKELKELFPDSACSLEYIDPMELMVSTQLSAQCTDKRVNMVTKDLFRKYRSIDDFADADTLELEQDIKSTGFFRNKAKNIKNMSIKLRTQYNYVFPKDLNELMKLDGVGRKTGNLFLSEYYNIPGIVVDTHVKRISKRLGLTNSQNPDVIEKELKEIADIEDWIQLGHLLITFGREICNARKPKCEICSFTKECDHYLTKK